MRGKILIHIYLFLAFLEIILIVFDIRDQIYLRPLCVLAIYSFYVINAKRQNYFLLFYLLCELVNEIFFLIDFKKYFALVLVCYTMATFSMIYHLWPVLKKRAFKFDMDLMIGPILGVLGTLYIFWEITLMIFTELPHDLVFFIGLTALVSWIFFCTLVPIKTRHPYNAMFYVLGGLMAIMAPTMFIHTFLWNHILILILSLLSMILLKIFLVFYLIKKDHILAVEEEYD